LKERLSKAVSVKNGGETLYDNVQPVLGERTSTCLVGKTEEAIELEREKRRRRSLESKKGKKIQTNEEVTVSLLVGGGGRREVANWVGKGLV